MWGKKFLCFSGEKQKKNSSVALGVQNGTRMVVLLEWKNPWVCGTEELRKKMLLRWWVTLRRTALCHWVGGRELGGYSVGYIKLRGAGWLWRKEGSWRALTEMAFGALKGENRAELSRWVALPTIHVLTGQTSFIHPEIKADFPSSCLLSCYVMWYIIQQGETESQCPHSSSGTITEKK